MQVDAEKVHEDECAREYERDAARDNKPGAETERKKADGEYDDDGECEGLHEVVDGALHDGGLIRHLVELGAEREILLNRGGQFFEMCAEGEDVAAVLHGDGNADGGGAVIEHFRIGRVDCFALDTCNVAEAEYFSVRGDGKRTDVLDVLEYAGGAEMDGVACSLKGAARHHGILRAERVRDCRGRDAKLRKAFEGDLYVDALALRADQDDLLHARNGEDAAPRILRHGAQFLVGVVRARDGVDGAVHIVKAVVVVGAVDTVRQVVLCIFAEIAHVAPCRANLGGVEFIAQLEVDDGLARAGFAHDLLEPRRILKTSLEFVRDLLLHFLCGCARPCGGDDHLADGEGGVLHAAKRLIGEDAAQGTDDDEIPDERAMAQREFGEVPHFVRTFSPSRSWWTPAVTMTAPCARPSTTASLA